MKLLPFLLLCLWSSFCFAQTKELEKVLSPGDVQKRMRLLEAEIAWRSKLINDLKKATAPARGQGECNACETLANQCGKLKSQTDGYPQCANGACDVALTPKEDLCYRVFTNTCYPALYPAALNDPHQGHRKVEGCWKVLNARSIDENEQRLDELQAELAQLKGLTAHKDESDHSARKEIAAATSTAPARVPANSDTNADTDTITK